MEHTPWFQLIQNLFYLILFLLISLITSAKYFHSSELLTEAGWYRFFKLAVIVIAMG
jgi:hypothetical protein